MCLVLDDLENSFAVSTFHVISDVLLEGRVRRNELQKLHEASRLVEVISSREIDLNCSRESMAAF